MMASFKEIAQAIYGAERIAVLSHVRPDGDAIGSQLALGQSLVSFGKSVVLWNQDGLPSSMAFLPHSELVTKPPPTPSDFDLVIALDTASKERLGNTLQSLGKVRLWINIDHHASNPGYGEVVFIDSNAPATGQIIYEFLTQTSLPFNQAIADALFVAISTDTGCFRYPKTSVRTFEIAAELTGRGVDVAEVSRKLYDCYPKRRIELLGRILPAARFNGEDRVASLSLTQATKDEIGILPDDVEGLIDYIRSVDTVLVAIFFEEVQDSKVRISMRSKDERIDVNRICSEFGGGGHLFAAGARMRGNIEAVQAVVLKRVLNEISQSL
ncbi:MAG: bifunctional oligoribonuclease/PAP phosphatase NrnA [Verrucomicrobia bacterium]|nr:bifunctional oligoribonuclease/PAP phosphatase NrnA [Verrucomicrobiota bacterium]MBV9673902.1 bifunctional oligoribonuclease/PAP phosphatase NrnA [Verrucomicrobiota bacterium]